MRFTERHAELIKMYLTDKTIERVEFHAGEGEIKLKSIHFSDGDNIEIGAESTIKSITVMHENQDGI